MASKEQFRKIAIYCDSYAPVEENRLRLKSNAGKFESCENCKHFYKRRKVN